MYKTESTLGLIGSILTVISASLMFLSSAAVTVLRQLPGFLNLPQLQGIRFFRFSWPFIDAGSAAVTAATIIGLVFGLMILTASAVLGFLGTSMLKKDNKKGGVLLVIAGGLMFLPHFSIIFSGTAVAILFLIGGILALTKKAPQI